MRTNHIPAMGIIETTDSRGASGRRVAELKPLPGGVDQQPVKAKTMVEACVEAFNVTREKTWFENAVMCFNWFLGHNELNIPLYDPKTGGCRDGLMADGINQNQGAESSLARLLSLVTLQKLYADEILNQPSSQKTD